MMNISAPSSPPTCLSLDANSIDKVRRVFSRANSNPLPPSPAALRSKKDTLKFNLNGAFVALVVITLLSMLNDDDTRQDLIILHMKTAFQQLVLPAHLLFIVLCSLCLVLAVAVFALSVNTKRRAKAWFLPPTTTTSSAIRIMTSTTNECKTQRLTDDWV